MPIGIIADVLAVALGGITGSLIGSRMSAQVKEKMTVVLGVCAMAIGLVSVILMVNLPAVVLAMIAGTAIGIAIRLGKLIDKGALRISGLFPAKESRKENDLVILAIILFCASGTGIYGTIVEGMSGDSSVLVSKSILDFVTAMIFACSAGPSIAAVAIPQAVMMVLLFFLSRLAGPHISDTMMRDFRACGGLITLVTGMKVAKIKDFPVAEMIPAMVLVFLTSYAWTGLMVH
jgi:hypothetical protein